MAHQLDRVVLHPWKRCKEFLNRLLWDYGYWGPTLVPNHLGQYPIQRLPVRILGALKKAMWLRSDRHVYAVQLHEAWWLTRACWP